MPVQYHEAISMGSHNINDVQDPVQPQQAATKKYVDSRPSGGLDQATADARYVNVAGDTMTGGLVVQRDTVGDNPANPAYHGLISATGRVLFPTAGDDMSMYIACLQAGGSIALVPNGNDYAQAAYVQATGEVTVQHDPITALGLATKQMVDAKLSQAIADGRYLLLTGGTVTGLVNLVGAAFGSVLAPGGVHDLSKHIALYSTSFGINVTSGAINIVTPATQFSFNNTGDLTLPADPTGAMGATTKRYVDSKVGGGGGMTRTVTVQTGGGVVAPAAANTDYVYICKSGPVFTMPTAVGNKNLYTFKQTDTSPVTIGTTSSQTIDGGQTFVMDTQWMSISLISDGANWMVV